MNIDSKLMNVDKNPSSSSTANSSQAIGQHINDQTKVSLEKPNSDLENNAVAKNSVDTIAAVERISEAIKAEASSEDVDKALEIVSYFFQSIAKQVDFSSDNQAGKTVVTVTDRETQEVINQFPSEKIISMAEKIQALNQQADSISGLLIDSHV